ncbi:MAG: tetratricopeptide repeat protein, partial [Gammaproteobacteria bacterium]|nr:tetratricopeptide repeat protein [Gammaproteobacteria bacterium]
LEAGREGAPDAGARLAGLVKDGSQPAIARATALHLLALHGYPHPGNLIEIATSDDSALVRRAGAGLLRGANLSLHLRAIAKLLDDPVRSVRIRTANALAGVQPTALPASAAVALKKASQEYLAARRLNADRPEAHLNLAAYLMRKHEFNRAQQELATALELDPAFVPAAINLADLYRASGQARKAEMALKNALVHSPDDPALLFSLALLKVRQDSRGEALDLLARTVDLAPSNPRYSYVYAIALHDGGKIEKAITVLEKALLDNPRNRRILAALVAYYTEIGDPAAARKYRKRLNHSAALN